MKIHADSKGKVGLDDITLRDGSGKGSSSWIPQQSENMKASSFLTDAVTRHPTGETAASLKYYTKWLLYNS